MGERPYGLYFTLGAGDEQDRWIDVTGGDLPCPISVRLGLTPSGRPCFTGVHIGEAGAGDHAEVNSKTLRAINLGNVMRWIREAAAADEPPWSYPAGMPGGEGVTTIGALLLGTADPTTLAVPRGPKGDPETDQRTFEAYERAVASGLSRLDAVAAVSVAFGDISISQVYRRMARARQRRSEHEGER
jgi:hypothetical protein